MTKIEAIYEREKQEALKENTEKVTKEVTQQVTQQVTKQVTRQVTYSLIFDMVNTGELNREDAMKRVGLSDDEFTRELTKYRREHSAEQVTV